MPSISIKINAKLFNALPIEDQSKITEIMKQTNLLDKQGSIVADSDAPDAQAQGFGDFIKGLSPCKIACDVAASAAAACTAGTAGAGLAVCLAVAAAAHQACKESC